MFRHALLAAVVVASLAVTATPAAAADSSQFAVHLQSDGDADVAVTYTFDLDTDSEQAAFQEIRNNQTVRDAYAVRFRDRLASVAANAADRSGREMSVSNASVDVRTDGDTGIVTLGVVWSNLAATDGDRLTVTEPFASGFAPDRQFVVTLPDGYAADASPAPDSQSDGRLAWDAGSDLRGFEFTASPESGESGSDGGLVGAAGPGFDLIVAVGALLAVALIAVGRRSR